MATAKQYSAAGNLILPNTFQHPNFFVDKLMHLLTPEENTVLTFAVRRILGFQENISSRRDHISLSQFTDGITAKNGTHLCHGCGLRKDGVRSALDALEKYKVLLPTSPFPDVRKGQEYWLQEDASAIDWEGLEVRQADKLAASASRTAKARSSVIQKGSVGQNTQASVAQTPNVLSDSNTKLTETQENNKGAKTTPLSDPSSMPIDWQLGAIEAGRMNASQITVPDAERQFMAEVDLSAFDLVQRGAPHLEGLHKAFMIARRIIPSNPKQLKGWRVAYQQMYDAKMNRVMPEHVIQAVEQLVSARLTVSDPFSVVATAISIANPVEVHSPNERIALELFGE